MKREIVELDDLLLIEAEHVARQHNKTLSDVIAEALRPYIDANRKPNQFSFIGIFASDGTPFTVEDQEHALREGLDPTEGWSPDRPSRPTDESRRATG